MQYAYYLELPLAFPEGMHFGAGSRFNRLAITRDGLGRPVWNGSSIAGLLRSYWRDYLKSQGRNPDDPSLAIFGRALSNQSDTIDDFLETGIESCVKVMNYVLQIGKSEADERTHHLRNRHRGTVVDNGLYSIESCPPNTSTIVGLWVRDQGEVLPDQIEEFISIVAKRFGQSPFIGGSSNRGFGRVALNGDCKVLRYDLSDIEQQAAYLMANREWRMTGRVKTGVQHSMSDSVIANDKPWMTEQFFQLAFTLKIPRGQDFLVADGVGENGFPEPQKVISADGREMWRVPGASLRGLLRGWFHRLVSLEARSVGRDAKLADSADAYQAREQSNTYTGEAIGRSFRDRSESAENEQLIECPIVSLFGNLAHPGRLKLSDGLAFCSTGKAGEAQMRVHVAVDRITGGAGKGLLFKNKVLTNTTSTKPTFQFVLQIFKPNEDELRWLVKSLLALHLGILRVGSSKSSGRLELASKPNPAGASSEIFSNLFSEAFHQTNLVTEAT